MTLMHELSLLAGVVDTVLDAAQGRRVSAIGLLVGARSGVLVDALTQAWPIASAHTPLEGVTLDIETQAATVFCPHCAKEVDIDEHFALTCPICATPTADLRKGHEFGISWVDVEATE